MILGLHEMQQSIHAVVSSEVVRLLLKAGVDISLTLTNCSTTLMTAARESTLEVLKLLVKQGRMAISAELGSMKTRTTDEPSYSVLTGYSAQRMINFPAPLKRTANGT